MKKFILLSVLLVVGRIYDPLTTYWYTPDLSHESNPVGRLLGLSGWTGIIITHSIVICLLLYALWVYCFKKVYVPPFDSTTTTREFASLFYFGNKHDFKKIWYRLSSNPGALLYSVGYIVSMTLISISYIVGTSTLMLVLSPKYHELYRAYNISMVLWLLILVLLVTFSARFFRKERKKRLAA